LKIYINNKYQNIKKTIINNLQLIEPTLSDTQANNLCLQILTNKRFQLLSFFKENNSNFIGFNRLLNPITTKPDPLIQPILNIYLSMLSLLNDINNNKQITDVTSINSSVIPLLFNELLLLKDKTITDINLD